MREILSALNDLTFDPKPRRDSFYRALSLLALTSLFVVGILHWANFLHFGNLSFETGDWPKEHHYYSVIKEFLANPTIPYFVTPGGLGVAHDPRFLGNPEPLLSPQIIALPFMSVGAFVLFNTLFMYSVGFAGCLLLRKRYELSLLPFILLFLLFNFNGHITSHIAVGHTTWYGYFLLPYFAYLVLEMVQSNGPIKRGIVISLSFLLFGLVLQGSFHIFIWCLIFLFLLGLFNRRQIKPVAIAIVLSLALSLFRLLPAAISFSGFKASYASGYPSVGILVDALTTIKTYTFEHPRPSIAGFYDVGWFEHDVYIGYVGVAFIAFFGIARRFGSHASLRNLRFQSLDLPLLLMALFSFGFVFDIISDLRIPILSWTERVPSRFLIVPLVMLIVISSIRLQGLLHWFSSSSTLKLLAVGAVGVLAHGLGVHSWFWRGFISSGSMSQRTGFEFNNADFHDTLYTTAVNVSAAISVVTLLSLLGVSFWLLSKRRA